MPPISFQTVRTHHKPFYTAQEAAETLGVSMEQLRQLVLQHINPNEEEVAHIQTATFQASDLVILRMLSRAMANN